MTTESNMTGQQTTPRTKPPMILVVPVDADGKELCNGWWIRADQSYEAMRETIDGNLRAVGLSERSRLLINDQEGFGSLILPNNLPLSVASGIACDVARLGTVLANLMQSTVGVYGRPLARRKLRSDYVGGHKSLGEFARTWLRKRYPEQLRGLDSVVADAIDWTAAGRFLLKRERMFTINDEHGICHVFRE